MSPSSTSRLVAAAPGDRPPAARPTAVVYCEGNFGQTDGKTANGLVRHSETLPDRRGDRQHARRRRRRRRCSVTAPNGIPVVAGLDEALRASGGRPDWFVFGMAPSSGLLSADAARRGPARPCRWA